MSLDLNINIDDIPWPDGTKRLFDEGGSNHDTAFLYPGTRTWEQYAYGYQVAYERLLEGWDTASFKPDAIAYPIVFLCRQYLELSLKGVFCQCKKLQGQPIGKTPGHHIDKWWERLRPMIEKIWPDDPVETLDHVQALLLEFADLDNQSTAFRYPADLDGKTSLPDLETLDFVALRAAMDQLSNFFTGISSAASVYLDYQDASRWGRENPGDQSRLNKSIKYLACGSPQYNEMKTEAQT